MDSYRSNSISNNECINLYHPTIFDWFFIRPRICIDYDEDKEPSVFSPSRDDKKYLRIRVRNRGRRTAKKCKAHLKVIPDGGDPMRSPSTDPKQLPWGRSLDFSDFETEKDIHPFIGEELLFVVFSAKWFTNLEALNTPQRYASIAVPNGVRGNMPRVEDSFATGNFIVELVITSENAYCRTKLCIYVREDYQAITMKRVSKSECLKLRIVKLKDYLLKSGS